MLDNGYLKHYETMKQIDTYFSNQGTYIAIQRKTAHLLGPMCFHNDSFTLKGKHEHDQVSPTCIKVF